MGKELKNFLFLLSGIVLGLVGVVGFVNAVTRQTPPTGEVIGYAVVFALGIALLAKYKG